MEYKGYNIVGDNTFGMVSIKPVGRGSVNNALLGGYTSRAFAMRAIDTFVSLSGKKEKRVAKDTNSSGV